MSKKLSCGIIFVDTEKEKILMIHPTNQKDYWDFPKGRTEIGETPLITALREVNEETGIELSSQEIEGLVDLGRHTYNRQKDLHIFICYNKEIDISKLHCSSMVDKPVPYPECDDFAFFSIVDAIDLMCPSMKKVFIYDIEPEIKAGMLHAEKTKQYSEIF